MKLQQLRYIITIAEELNITNAAEKLYISQSALSQQLSRIEKELGTELFYRDERVLKITKAGDIYLTAARAILNIGKSFQSELKLREDDTHIVKIAVSTQVPDDIAEFIIQELYKQIVCTNVKIFVHDDIDFKQCERALLENHADIVIGISDTPASSSIEMLVQMRRGYTFCFPRSSTRDDAVLSAAGTALRTMEDTALKEASILVTPVDECPLTLVNCMQKRDLGFFCDDMLLQNSKTHLATSAQFYINFTAKMLKDNTGIILK